MTKYCADLQGGLWLQYNTQNATWYGKPCCLYQEVFPIDHSIAKEFWQHPKIIQQRQDNLLGKDLPEQCRACRISEENGTYSRRQSWNDRLGTNWSNLDSVLELDLQCDFSCNLACRICGPQYSTLWRKVDPDYKKIEKKFKVRANNSNIFELLETVSKHSLKQIHFQGGEPFLSNTHLQILEQLVEQLDVSQITLWYHSNGTVKVSDHVFKMWEKFRLVEIYFSLDDIGTRMEYQRWPMTWQEVHENMLWYKENIPHNVLLNVERTVSVLNAYWLDELETWHKEYFAHSKYGDTIPINYHRCAGVYALNSVTKEYKQAVLSKYDVSHWVHKTFSNLNVDSNQHIVAMFDDLNKHDALRNQNWKTIFPEFLQWYQNFVKH